MKARLIAFPVKGRTWCFSRCIDQFRSNSAQSQSSSSTTPSTFRDLCKSLSSDSKPISANAELVVDFVSSKMNNSWTGLEKAPQGSLKNKIHCVGLWLLARVQPSEIFLKSITKEVTEVEVTYPTSLNARLVRRRLRHIAMSGSIIHKKYLYGSAALLPVSTVFMVLPLPNIPFFWLLYRTYSHWRALQGSEKLLHLVSEGSDRGADSTKDTPKDENKPQHRYHELTALPWILRPSKELEELIRRGNTDTGLGKSILVDICKTFNLNSQHILKYQKL
ncbi:uncharacterized protein LOC141633312 [Silene latifolia]|uniref:uncharacterized protein LOC141633312 n=1 Tax=Silene latifolia TaxID=37657 RepID=UPI003D77957C